MHLHFNLLFLPPPLMMGSLFLCTEDKVLFVKLRSSHTWLFSDRVMQPSDLPLSLSTHRVYASGKNCDRPSVRHASE